MLAILIPTRDRNHKIKKLHEEWFKMTDPSVPTDCVIILDEDNEHTYERLDGFIYHVVQSNGVRGMTRPLNAVAKMLCHDYQYIGFWGDDHVPCTRGWNSLMVSTLEHHKPYSMVYGNDLLQQSNLPTEIIMDSRYVQKLGYMVPPSLVHLYVDNLWLFIGNFMKNIHYMPDVIIEHQHYTNKKAPVDDLYLELNSNDADRATYEALVTDPAFLERLTELANDR